MTANGGHHYEKINVDNSDVVPGVKRCQRFDDVNEFARRRRRLVERKPRVQHREGFVSGEEERDQRVQHPHRHRRRDHPLATLDGVIDSVGGLRHYPRRSHLVERVTAKEIGAEHADQPLDYLAVPVHQKRFHARFCTGHHDRALVDDAAQVVGVYVEVVRAPADQYRVKYKQQRQLHGVELVPGEAAGLAADHLEQTVQLEQPHIQLHRHLIVIVIHFL